MDLNDPLAGYVQRAGYWVRASDGFFGTRGGEDVFLNEGKLRSKAEIAAATKPPSPPAPKAAPAPPPAAAPYVSKYWNQEFIDKHGAKAITWKKLDGILSNLQERIFKALIEPFKERDKAIDDLADRLASLEKTVEELKAAQTKTLADAFRGAWQPNTGYARGSLVVKDGGLWLAMANATTKPGSSAEWRLVTKAGKDGKDLRG